MSNVLHIVLDNNLPHTVAREAGVFWGSSFPRWTVRHERDIAKPACLDSHWIPKLRTVEPEGEWLIFTRDHAKHTSKENDKLPLLCKKHDHAYVIVTERLQRADMLKGALSAMWTELPFVVGVCRKIRRRNDWHVRLSHTSLKKGAEKIWFHIRGTDINELEAVRHFC